MSSSNSSRICSLSAFGISTVNTKISNNSCGVIGYLTSSVQSTYALDTRTDRTQGLAISGNVCNLIGNLVNVQVTAPGTYILTVSDASSGSVHISDNDCHWIWVVTALRDASFEFSQTMITQNRLTAYDQTYFDQYVNGSSVNIIAIAVNGNSTVDEEDDVIITDNSIRPGRFGAVSYTYDVGINLTTSASVRGNLIFKCLAASGVGINAAQGAFGPLGVQYTISHNKIYRGTGTNIANYIALSTVAGSGGLCVDNYFDLPTIDGSLTTVVTAAGTRSDDWVVERNKNQTVVQALTTASGNISIQGFQGIGAVTSLGFGSAYQHAFPLNSSILGTFTYPSAAATNSIRFGWLVDCREALPSNVKILEISIVTDGDPDCDTADTGFHNLFIEIGGKADGVVGSSTPGTDVVTSSAVTHTLSDPGDFTDVYNTATRGIQLRIDMLLKHAANQLDVDITSFTVTYRW